MGFTVLVFAVELQKVHTKSIFSDFWERTGASFEIECMWNGEESIKKIRFYRIYIEISHLGHNELSNTRTAYVMHIPNTLSVTVPRNNRNQKFQLRFSLVNFILMMLLHMLFFYGGHLIMHS